MSKFNDIYIPLRDEVLPALKERAKANKWPGVWQRSFQTYKSGDSYGGIDLSFLDRETHSFMQKFYIECCTKEDTDDMVCQEEECTHCQIKNTDVCPCFKGVEFRYDLINTADDKSTHEEIGKAISEYISSLADSLREESEFSRYSINDFRLSYGSYELYIPDLNFTEREELFALMDYILVQKPFKLPSELVRLYEYEQSLSNYGYETHLRRQFLKEFVYEEFFKEDKEEPSSPNQRKELLEKLRKDNPYFKELTKKMKLEIDSE